MFSGGIKNYEYIIFRALIPDLHFINIKNLWKIVLNKIKVLLVKIEMLKSWTLLKQIWRAMIETTAKGDTAFEVLIIRKKKKKSYFRCHDHVMKGEDATKPKNSFIA